MKVTLFTITWASAHLLYCLPIVICAIGVVVWCYCTRKKLVTMLSAVHIRQILMPNYSGLKHIIKALALSVGIFFLFLACLQPQWDTQEQPIAQEGRDLFIALDISKSMLATDVQPNRLTVAKNKIMSLLPLLQSERIGLLLFSGSCIVQCPLTTDYGAFTMFLNQVDHTTMSSGTTALDTVLQKVIEMFKTMQSKKNKLVVVFTDGEDFSSNLSSVKQEAEKIGLRIITVGVGTPEGAPIPLVDDYGRKNGYQKDEKGAVVISALNEGILSSLSSYLHGFYIRSSSDATDLKKIVSYVEKMEKETFDNKKVRSLKEQYHYFIGISLVCFILEWLL